MNRTFKVVFNRARACLMVANEITSSVQKKGCKTVIATAVALATLGAGFEALATTYTTEQDLTADTTYDGDLFNSGGRITIKESISAKLQNTTHSLINYSGGNGAAIFVNNSGATVELNNSDFQNNTNSSNPGGAISVGGTFTSKNLTKFIGNSASSGGAIYSWATADITGNLFSANKATDSSGEGGAIYVSSNTTTIGSTKFVLNSAKRYGGAIYLRYYENTNSSSALNLNAGTQFLSNKGSAGGAIYADGKTLNITGTGTEESSSVVFDSNESTSGEGGAIYLSDNTEATITYATFKGNEASTSGGAIYLEGKSTAETTAASPFTNLTFTSNKATQGGAIFVGSNRNLSIGSTNTFTGNTSTGTGGGAIYLDNKSTLALGDTFDVLKFTGNTATNYGGAIYSKGTLSVTNTSFSTSEAKSGGALYLGNSVTIGGSTFTSNVATTSGGAIYSGADSLTLNNSIFKGNSAKDSLIGYGGALYAGYGLITLSGVTFGGTGTGEGNTAGKNGGAIYLTSAKDNTITDSSFIANTASAGYGGAIAFGSSTSKLTITGNNTFTDNTAKTSGGAIYNQGTLTIGSETGVEGVTAFKSNSTAGYGGAICTTFSSSDNSKVNLAVYNALFGGSETGDGNSASSGGAIAARNSSISSVSGSTFTANNATSQGGAIHAAGTSFDITGSTFTGNTANYGGAIYQAGGTLTINAGTIFGGDTDSDGNKASGNAGAIYVSSGRLNITGTESSNVSFKKNTSDSYGGAIYFGAGTNATIEYATFEENSASSYRGGAIELDTGSSVTIKNSTFTSNSGTYGGASSIWGTLNVLETNTFTSNESRTQSGGAFYVPSTNNAVLVVGESGTSTYSTFTKNKANTLGGAIHINGGTGTIYSGHFEENEAGSSGGAIALGSVTTATSIVGSSSNKLVFNKNVAKGTGSYGGGAIYVSSTAGEKTIGHATFTENTAAVNGGAILLSSSTPTSLVTISDSTFTGNAARTVDSDGNYVDGFGGAIYLTARSNPETTDATPYTSLTFISNTAGTAGAIYVGAKRKLSIGSTNSFTSNASTGTTAGTGGGAIFLAENATLTLGDSTDYLKFETNSASYAGGAVYTQGTLNVTNTDFTKNTATTSGGALNVAGGTTSISGTSTSDLVTFTENSAASGGAIYSSATLNLENTSFGGTSTDDANSAVSGGAIYVANGTTALTGTNTFTSNSAAAGGAIYAADGTLTIGKAGETTKTTFKSNEASTAGGAIYINKGTHSITNTVFGGTGSNEGNTAENGGAIYVAGAATTTIAGVSTSDAVTFTANKTTEGAGGAIYAIAGSTTNLKNATFTSNKATTYGGAVNIEDTATKLDADAVTFTSNTASNAGGAIAARSNSVSSVLNSTFTANKATYYGGAIYAAGLSFDVSHSSFTNNTAQFGGAINASGASIDVSDSIFTSNIASSNGGALYVSGAKTTIGGASTSDKVTFTSNSATAGDGGAIYATDGSTTNLKNATFTSNTAMYGGALNIAGAATNLYVDTVTFTNNKATILGGAVTFSSLSVAQTGSITFTDVTFEKNEAASAGAVSLGTKRVASIDGTSAFLGNKATSSHGGAIMIDSGSSLTIRGTTSFTGNTASSGYHGGAIYSAGTLDVTGASFGGAAEANTATNGGAIYAGTDSKLTLQDSTFTANDAGTSGGAVYLNSAKDNTITSSSFIGNTATSGYGGAIYLDGTLNASGASFGGAETSDANKASYGGAVYADVNSKLTLGSSTFTANVATTSGGAIYLNSANGNSIAATSFTGNTATAGYGGAIYLASGSSTTQRSVTLTGVNTFTQNASSAGSGGALYVGSYITVDGTGADSVVFTGNNSSSNGGAIYVDRSSTVTLKNGQFTDNVADTSKSTKGGALYLGESASAKISATENYAITGNQAALGGFAYLGKSAFLMLEAAEGNVLTVGKEANAGTEIDSIASDDTFTSTLALQGEGQVVLLGKTSDYSGNVKVGTDSKKTTAEVAGTFSSAIRNITLGDAANLTIKGDQVLSSDRDSESATSITLGDEAKATLNSLTLAASDAANVTTDGAGKKTASKKSLATLSLGEKANVTIENTLTVGDCATFAITGAGSTTESEANIKLQKFVTGNGSSTSIGSQTSEKVRVEVTDFALDDQSAVKVKNGATLATTSNQIDAMKQGVATSFEEQAWLEFTDNGTVEESTFETLLKSTGDTSDNAQNIRFENGILQASDGDKDLEGDVNLHIGQMTGFDKATVEANRELILGKADTTSDVTEINTDAEDAKLNIRAGKLVTKTKSLFTNVSDTDAFATTIAKKENVTIGDSSTTGNEVSFDFIDEGTATLSAYTAMQSAASTTNISLSNATLAADDSGKTLEVKDNALTLGAASGFEKITIGENVTFNLGNKALGLTSVVDNFDLTATGAKLNLNGGKITTSVAALFKGATAGETPFTGVAKKDAVTVADSNEVINFTDQGTATLTEYEALRNALKSGTDEKLLNVNLVNATVKADSETTFTTDANLTFGAMTGFDTVTVSDAKTLTLAGAKESSKTVESYVENITLGEGSKLNLTGGRLASMSTSLFERKVSEGTATSQFAANENKKANVLIANGTVGVDLLDLGVCDIAVYEDLKGKLTTVDGSDFDNLSLSNATLKANDSTNTFTVEENQYLSFGAMSGFDTVTVKAGGELNLGTLESSANAVALDDVSNLNLQGGTIHTTRASLLAGVSFADASQKSGINILSADANVDFIDGGATVSKSDYLDKVRASLKVSGTSETLKGVSLSRSTLAADDSTDGKSFTTDAKTLMFGAMAGFETVTVSEGNTLHVGYTGLTSTVDNFNLTASEAKLYLDGGTLNTKAGALFTSTDSASGSDGVFTNLTKKAVTVTDTALVLNLKDTGTCLFADYDQIRSDLGVVNEDNSVTKLLNVNLENATLKADTTKTFTTESNLTFGAMDGFTSVNVGAGKTLTVGNATHGLATAVDTFALAEGSRLNLIDGSVATKTASIFTGVNENPFAMGLEKNVNVTIANSSESKNVTFDFIDEGTAELTTYNAMRTAVATDDVSLSKATLHANTEDKTFTVSSTLTKDGITFAAMTDFTEVTVGQNKTLTLGNKDLLEVSSIETITLSSDSAATSGKLHLTGGKLKTKAQSILTGIADDLTASTVAVKDAVTIDNDDTTKRVSFDFVNEGTATLSSYTAMQKAKSEGGLGTTDISFSNATLAADTSGNTLNVKDNGLSFAAATGFEKITVAENVTFNLGSKSLSLASVVDDFDLTATNAKLNLNGGILTTTAGALFTGSTAGETPFTGVTKKEGITVSDSSEVINFTNQGTATLTDYEALRTTLKSGDDGKLLNVNLINATVKADSVKTFKTDTDLTFGAMAGFETVKVADGNTLSIGTDAANLESSIDEITLGVGSKLNLTAGKLSTKTKSLFTGTDSGAYATDLALKEGVAISNSEGSEKVSFDFIDEGTSSLTAYKNIRSKVATKDVSLSRASLEADGDKNFTTDANLTFGAMTGFNEVTVKDGKTLTFGKAGAKSDIKTISLGTGSALTVAGGELATGRSQLIDELADSFTKKDGITLDASVTIDINDGIETTYTDYQKLQSALGQNAATPLAGLSLSKSLLKGEDSTDFTSASNVNLTFGAIEDFNSIAIGNDTKVYVVGKVLGSDGALVDANSTLNNVSFGNDASQLHLLNGKVVTEANTFLTDNTFEAASNGHVFLDDAVDVTLTNEGEITHSVYNALKTKLTGADQQDHAKLSLNKAVLKADTAETGGKSFTATEDLTFGAMTGFETVTVGGESANQTLTLNGATVDGKTVTSEITNIVLSGNSKLHVAGGSLKTKSTSLFASAVSDGSNFGTQDKKATISIAADASIDLTDTGTCTFANYEALREKLGDGTTALTNLSLSNALLKGDGTSNLTVGSGQALSFGAISSFRAVNVTTGGKLTIGDTDEDLSSLLGDASLTIDNVSALNLAGGKVSAKRSTLVEGADFANSSAKTGVNVLSQDVEIDITDRIASGVTVSEYNKVREALGVKDSSGPTTEALKKVSLSQSALVGSNDTFTADASVCFGAMQNFSTVALNGKTLHIGNKDVNLESTVGDFDFTGEGSAVSFEGGSLRTKVAALFGTNNALKGDVTVTNADFVLNLTDAETRTLTDYEALRTALSNDAVKFRNVNMENATIAADTTTVFDADTDLTFGAMTDFDKVTVSGGKTLSLGKNNSDATSFTSTIKDFDLSDGHLKLEGGTIDTTMAALFKEGKSDAVKNVTVTNSDVVVNFTDNTTTNLSDYEAMRQSLNNVNDTTSNHLVNVNLKEGTLKADSETTFTSDGNLTFGAMTGFTEVGAATGCELHIGKAGSNLVSTIDNIDASGNVYLEGGTLNTYAAGLLTGSGLGDSLLAGANKKTGITVTDKEFTVNFKDEGTALLSNYNAVRSALQAESSDESLKAVNLENATLKADGEKAFTTDANLTFGAISDFSKVTVAEDTTLSLGHETLNLASTTSDLEVNGVLNIVGKVNNGEDMTVDVTSTLSGSGRITVGDPAGVGADIHVHSLAMTGGSLFIDPFYENAHSTMTVDEVSGGLNSNLTVGNNALLVIGDTLSNAQTALTKLTAQKPSFGEIRSIAYVATPINVLEHGSIIITPSASSVALNTDSSVTVTHSDASTTNFGATSVHVADYGALVINQEKIGSNTVFTGASSIRFADEGVLAIVNAEAGTIDLASSETSITAPRNVITDNPYYDGSVDENGNVVIEQNALQGNLALASTGIQAMTRRADFVLAKTISNRSYEERESDVSLWVDVGGEGYKATRLANGASFKSDMGYGVFGADYAFGNGVLAGAAFQYGKGTIRGGFESIKNKVKNYAGTAYVAFGPGKAKFVLDAAYVKQDNSITSAQAAFNQSVDSEMFSVGAAVRAGFKVGNCELTPSFGLRFSKLKTDTMRSGNLELAKQNQTLIQAPISLSMKTRTTSADGWTVEPEAKISFVPTFGDKEVRILGSEQTVLDTNPIQGDLGVSLKKGNLKIDATFSYGAGSLGTTSVGGKVGLKYLF